MRYFMTLMTAVSITLTAVAQSTGPRAEWRFKKNDTAHFTESGHYHAASGEGVIEFVSKQATTTTPLHKNSPSIEQMQAGDYWLMRMPVEQVKAGSVVDVWFPFLVAPHKTPHTFICEYRDGKQWLPAEDLTTGTARCLSTTAATWPRFTWRTFRLKRGIKRGELQFRLRQVDHQPLKTTLYGGGSGDAPKMVVLDNRTPADTTRLLFIGNSYTFYNLYPMQLTEIAWYEGHYLDCEIYVHGGYNTTQHLANHVAHETIAEGGYDYTFLQDQSLSALYIGTTLDHGVISEMKRLITLVKEYNPQSTIFIEQTWGRREGNNAINTKQQALVEAHPSFFTDYEAMQRVIIANTNRMSEELDTALSPVGVAWQIVRREHPEIELYAKDAHHPSTAGSYLSAVVAYQMLFRTPFSTQAANVDLDAATAAYLRSVAERVVLQGEQAE
ncbi:MAG: hypothetical protein IJ502_05090 [Alistipes sp.]|nr:hypothetical protein [Alistipes sp.]